MKRPGRKTSGAPAPAGGRAAARRSQQLLARGAPAPLPPLPSVGGKPAKAAARKRAK